MKIGIKVISCILSVCLLSQTFTVLADSPKDDQKTSSQTTSVSSNSAEKKEEPKIIGEVTEKREANVKNFLLSDGTFEAVVYKDPVHYLNNGKWEDIDNTLIESSDSNVQTNDYLQRSASDSIQKNLKSVKDSIQNGYVNKDNNFNVKFAKDTSSSNLVRVKDGKYQISWGLSDNSANKKSSFQAKNKSEASENSTGIKKANDAFTKLTKLDSGCLYSDVYPNVDLQYVLSGQNLKEYMVLKDKTGQTDYSFTYHLDNLDMRYAQDGSIEIFDPSDSSVKYTLLKPTMMDSNGTASDRVTYSFEKQKNDYVIKVSADKTWVTSDNRKFPVYIDPDINNPLPANSIHETFVASSGNADPDSGRTCNNTSYTTYGSLYLGNEYHYGVCRTYIRFDLPTLSASSRIIGARLNLYQFHSDPTFSNYQINVHNVTSGFDDYQLTWNNQPGYDPTVVDYTIADSSSQWRYWDVTKIVSQWYSTGVNNGLMLKADNENTAAITQYYSSDFPYLKDNGYPSVFIKYRDTKGLEDYWTYHSNSLGRSGTGYVQDFSGNLVYQIPILSESGSRMPLNLYLTYNSANKNSNFSYGLKCGNGWQLNISQRIDSSGITDYPWVYTDTDGTQHYFTTQGTDEDGLGYTLTVNADGSKILTDKKKNQLIFNSAGYLTQSKDTNSNIITYNYGSNNVISTITDGAGRTTTIGVDSSGLLNSITDSSGRKTTFSMNGSNLASVTYPDGKSTRIDYTPENNIVKVTDTDGQYLQFNYNGLSKVSGIEQHGTDGSLGQSLSVDYSGKNVTKFTDNQNRSETYQFNEFGNTTCVIGSDGNASMYDYSHSGLSSNKLTAAGKTTKAINNMIVNGNVESNDYYTAQNWGDSTNYSIGITSEEQLLGNNSLKLYAGNGSNPDLSDTYCLSLVQGQTYTFSAYVKTNNVNKITPDGGACIGVYTSAGWAFSNSVAGTNDWQRVSVTFTSQMTGIGYFHLKIKGATGTAYYDCIQCEQGSAANRYNMLDNSSFEAGSGFSPEFWTSVSGVTGSDGITSADHHAFTTNSGSHSYLINGNVNSRKYISEAVNIKPQPEGDDYIVSGWAKANSAPIGVDDNRRFAITVEVRYTDGTSKWQDINFNPYVSDWQYVSKVISTDDGNASTNKTYSGIAIYLCYYGNTNAAYFDDMQLVKDEAQSYQYDSNGNLVSTSDQSKQNSTFSYSSDNNLIKATNPSGISFDYTYDNNHNVTTAKNSDGVAYGFSYDNFGNPIASAVSSTDSASSDKIYSSAGYSPDGNYISSVTDSRGNTTKYSYDTSKGTLTNTIDPLGNKTNYTYDSNNDELKSVSKTVNGQTISNSYTYNNGYLSAISHNGTNYTFNYDAFGNTSSVNVGNQQLISNSYLPNNGNLNQVSYGNGATINYSYDSQDRVTQKSYNGVPAYSYSYDASGNLYTTRDLTGGDTTHNTYDFINRLTKTESSNGFSTQINYDLKNRISSFTDALNGIKNTVEYAYGNTASSDQKAGLIYGVKVNGTTKLSYSYDKLSRQQSRTLNMDSGVTYASNYSYTSGKGPQRPAYDASNATQRTVSGDFNGDGRADIATINDCGNSQIRIDTWLSNGSTFTYSPGWYSTGRGAYNASKITGRVVSGDFNGDGKDDIAAMYDYGNYQMQLHVWLSTGSSFQPASPWFATGTGAYDANSVTGRMVSGDFNGDGKDDIATMYDYGNYQMQLHVWLSNGSSFQSTSSPWLLTGTGAYDANSVNGRMVSGDFNGDGKDDIATMYNYGNYQVQLHVWLSNGSAFQSTTNLWFGTGTGAYDPNNVSYRFVTGDFNGDGRDDICSMYDYGNSQIQMHLWLSTGNSFNAIVWYGQGYFDANQVTGRMVAGDYNKDGKADIFSLYYLGTNSMEINGFVSTGSGFAPSSDLWNYSPVSNSGNFTTTLLSSITNGTNAAISYTYDEVGNISTISEGGTQKAKYYYDELNELIREDNAYLNKTITYTYDAGGNITAKTEYPYTTGSLGTATATIPYAYGDSNWKDKLTNYNGTAITYDEIGNPLSYRDGITFKWQNGRQLATASSAGNSVSYKYDDSGIRTQKTVNGTVTNYYLDGSSIATEITGSNRLDYFYDEKGNLFGFNYNGTPYYYIRNGQNDIIGILDSTGNQVVTYSYDTWGKLVSTTGSLASTVGAANPFRYRGYYYDSETGLYYLNSRYYDPVTLRFINADGVAGANKDITAYNMFSYCSNNPINLCDPSGNAAVWVELGFSYNGTIADFHNLEQGKPPIAYQEFLNNGGTINKPKVVEDYGMTRKVQTSVTYIPPSKAKDVYIDKLNSSKSKAVDTVSWVASGVASIKVVAKRLPYVAQVLWTTDGLRLYQGLLDNIELDRYAKAMSAGKGVIIVHWDIEGRGAGSFDEYDSWDGSTSYGNYPYATP